MIYIRNIFNQDLREGKQIAFTKDISNLFFNFNFNTPDPERKIDFIFKEQDSASSTFSFNNNTIQTRLYATSSESRIDGELKRFLIDKLKAKVDDIVVFRKLNDKKFEFNFFAKGDQQYSFYKSILDAQNHQIVLSTTEESDQETDILTTDDIIERFASWLNLNPKSKYFNDDHQKTIAALNKIKEQYNHTFGKDPFHINFEQLEDNINELNENIWKKDTDFWNYSEKYSNHLPRAILNKENYQRFLRELKTNKNQGIKGNNVIYYGAPGTGKSYHVDQIIKTIDPAYYERVTFHPDYDHTSFVGGYRPKTIKNESGKTDIVYEFVPQAFSRIYTRAWKNLKKPHYLVIEEINRGNCAEIFGDIFQLLDRESNYTVSPSEEFQEYLITQFDNNKSHEGISRGLKIPPNLFVYATMNTSDQSLFPMDSAFKRRWEWEYVPICYNQEYEEGKENPSYNFLIELPDGSKYRWIDFIAKINNNHIKDNPILGMDKCIGNYFIKPKEDANISLKTFINKVVFYLWNDVFKDEENSVFEANSSYEDFFPIGSNGLEKIKELFKRIDLQPISAEESKYNQDKMLDTIPIEE